MTAGAEWFQAGRLASWLWEKPSMAFFHKTAAASSGG
jgi:hypothetical protein